MISLAVLGPMLLARFLTIRHFFDWVFLGLVQNYYI